MHLKAKGWHLGLPQPKLPLNELKRDLKKRLSTWPQIPYAQSKKLITHKEHKEMLRADKMHTALQNGKVMIHPAFFNIHYVTPPESMHHTLSPSPREIAYHELLLQLEHTHTGLMSPSHMYNQQHCPQSPVMRQAPIWGPVSTVQRENNEWAELRGAACTVLYVHGWFPTWAPSLDRCVK